MKIAISAESTVDLTKELLEEFNIHTVPFTLVLGDECRLDDNITTDEIIGFVSKTGILPKTSAVNQEQYIEHFTKLLEDYDYVIHFTLSSEMSLAYQNAVRASEEVKKVTVINSKSLSTGIALLAVYASQLVKEGFDAKRICEMVTNRIENVQASFVINRLDYLYKGGRCSSLAFFGANLLKIRPQILVKNGKMVTGNKYRGNMSIIVSKYLKDILAEFNNPDYSQVFITYTTCSSEIVEKTKEALYAEGFKNVYVTRAGGTITSHCGEECLGVLYFNDGVNN